MQRVHLITKNLPYKDKYGKPIPGLFRNVSNWAVLDGNLRNPVYETDGPSPQHRREAELWLTNHLREQSKCGSCEE